MSSNSFISSNYFSNKYFSEYYFNIGSASTSGPELTYPLTVLFREGVSRIELGQSDSREIDAVLLGAGIGIDLTLATDIKFVMTHGTENHRYVINCSKGSIYKNNYISPVHGGITCLITDAESTNYGYFRGQFVIEFPNGQKTVPGSGYIDVYVNKSL